MTARAVFAAWAVAAALLVSAVVAMIVAAGPPPPIFHGAPVAVIGSSLIHNAIPGRWDGHAGLLGDGRPHWRVGINAISEADTTALLAHAIDEHAKVALVEANILLFDYGWNRARGSCDQPAGWLRRELKRLQLDVTDVYARLLGRPRELDEDSATGEFEANMFIPEARRGTYPLILRGPCRIDVLDELAARARAAGTVIVLLVPPRSNSADHLLGPIQKPMITARAQALAKRLNAALFVVPGPWPDAEFVDGEHFNRRGRAHFIAVLRSWWAARR